MDGVEHIGRGVAFPMRVDPAGGIALTTGVAELDESLRMVLSTAPGERVMRPEFGCRIHEMVFDPINPTTQGAMAQAVREALARWEPRVDVERVDVVGGSADSARVELEIEYRVRTTNDRRNLVYPFYVIPEASG